MEKYILEQIKENKIKNNVYCPIVILEKDIFEYNGKEYINLYVYSKELLLGLEINNQRAISVNSANLKNIGTSDHVYTACFLYNDIKDNIVINNYQDVKGRYDIKEVELVDYNDIDFNKNNVDILKELNLKGFKEIKVVPKIKENYWICSCGQYNNSNECSNCSTKKGFVEYYATEKDIQQKYAEKKFDKQRFTSENMEEEIENFKNRILNDKKYKIKEEYLDKEFFDNLINDTKNKVTEFKNRDNRNKYIKRNLIIVAIIIVILLIVLSILSSIKKTKDTKELINKYFGTNEYKDVNSIEKAIDSNDCGTMVYYLSKKRVTSDDKLELIKSYNKTYYDIYYEVNKENIHESLSEDNIYLSYTYMQYLGENNYEIPEDAINDALTKLVVAKDKENFAKVASLLKGKDTYWEKDFVYFDYGHLEYVSKDEDYKLDYSAANENTKQYTEFSRIYNEESGKYKCFVSDLHSVENMKLIFENNNNNACGYNFSNKVAYLSTDYIDMFNEAGGSFAYSSYLGGFYHHLVKDAKYSDLTAEQFEEKSIKLKKYKTDINLQMDKDDANPGFTPLDTFIYTYSNTCRSASGRYPNAYEVKQCNLYKSYYKTLKRNGAVCNKQCNDEKYFK